MTYKYFPLAPSIFIKDKIIDLQNCEVEETLRTRDGQGVLFNSGGNVVSIEVEDEFTNLAESMRLDLIIIHPQSQLFFFNLGDRIEYQSYCSFELQMDKGRGGFAKSVVLPSIHIDYSKSKFLFLDKNRRILDGINWETFNENHRDICVAVEESVNSIQIFPFYKLVVVEKEFKHQRNKFFHGIKTIIEE